MKKIIFALLLLFALKSATAQTTWTWQNPLPQGNSLADIEFINANTAVAVGDGGTIDLLHHKNA